MEFSSRGFQRSAQTPASAGHGSSSQPNRPVHKKAVQKIKESKPLTILWLVFFGSVTVLAIALIFSIATKSAESSLVEKDNYQAVFLENGQAYFGKVKSITSDYIDLRDVYYLYNSSTDTQDQSAANLSLVKLGTELHCPKDQMIIYRDQVTFWENLNPDGKVADAIKNWKGQNKDGVKCNNSTTQTTQQESTSPQQPTSETPNTSNNNATDSSSNNDTDTSTSNNDTSDSDTSSNNENL